MFPPRGRRTRAAHPPRGGTSLGVTSACPATSVRGRFRFATGVGADRPSHLHHPDKPAANAVRVARRRTADRHAPGQLLPAAGSECAANLEAVRAGLRSRVDNGLTPSARVYPHRAHRTPRGPPRSGSSPRSAYTPSAAPQDRVRLADHQGGSPRPFPVPARPPEDPSTHTTAPLTEPPAG